MPAPLQAELDATLAALAKKYGAAAVMLGTHIENLATVATLVASADLQPGDRERAAAMARKICADVIRALGEALNVDPAGAFAVAQALAEYSRHAESELVGEQPVPESVISAAQAVIGKAGAH